MPGGFLVVSVAPSEASRITAAIDGCRPRPRLDLDADWVSPDQPSLVVRTWRRPDQRSSSIERADASLSASFGVDVASHLVAADGRAEASADPLGYGALFSWTGEHIAAVSTRIEVLEQLAARWGEPLVKSAELAEGMAYTGFLPPPVTGFGGVRGVDPDEVAVLHHGTLRLLPNPDAIAWDRSETWAPLPDLVQTAADSLTATLERALSGQNSVVVDLTAGYDSQLVLGALLRADIAHDLEFQTLGPQGLHDVDVARARAAQLGLDHRTGIAYPLPSGSFRDRFITNAWLTGGLNNPKDGFREPSTAVDQLRVSGLYGELLRGWRGKASRTTSWADRVAGIARGFGAGRLQLLDRESEARAATATASEIIDATDPQRTAWHAAHRFYARNRLRSRAVRLDDVTPECRLYPLFSKTLVEIGLDAMWHHPDAPFGDLLLERLAPVLAEPPPPVAGEPAAVATDADSENPASLVRLGLREQQDDRAAFMVELGTVESDAWTVIDNRSFRAAADDYASLPNLQLRILHGAANAVIWLSDLVDADAAPGTAP